MLNTNSPTTRAAVESANRVKIRKPSKADVLAVWADLRECDALELRHGAARGEFELAFLIRTVREDRNARCAYLDGRPFALFGCNGQGADRYPWLLATPDLAKVGLTVTRRARLFLNLWMADPGVKRLWNIAPADSPNLRWLERLGFTVGGHFTRDCPNGERALYRPFWIG